jgi:3-dehydroquinate synthase
MVTEARLAEQIGLAGAGLATAVRCALTRAGLPTLLPAGMSVDAVLAETHGDKKSRAGAARYALPRGIGEMEAAEGRWAVPVNDAIVREALKEQT